MSSAIPVLPTDQTRRLIDGYDTAVAAKRRQTVLGGVILLILLAIAARVAEVDPAKLAANGWRFFNYIHEIIPPLKLATLGADLAEWLWGWKRWAREIGETLLMAYVGTASGALGAFVLCFLASRNMTRSHWLVFAARRYLEFCRTVPEIVFALIFVVAFGLGPMAGVLAIAIHTTGALGKLFAEVVENIDMKPVEGIAASGGSWVQQVRFGALPQVLSNFASYGLLRFEINVRGAAVMGFVGAGGIGQTLIEAIRKFYYTDVSAILLMVILTVVGIDLLTERVRHRLIGMEAGR